MSIHEYTRGKYCSVFFSSIVPNHNLSLPVDQEKEVVEVKRGDDAIIDCLTDPDDRSVALATVVFSSSFMRIIRRT